MQFDFWTIVYFILIFGFFGGVSSYIAFCVYGTDGGFRDKFHINIGPAILFTAMNGIVGVAGAFAIQVLLLGMRFYDKTNPVASDFIYLAAICLIGGFAARSFLSQVSQMFAKQMEQKIAEANEKAEQTLDSSEEQAKQIVLLASMSDNSPQQMLEFVVKTADTALKKNPDDATFIVAKGAALKRLNKVQQAIDTLTPYIETHGSASKPDKYISTAFFNRACYNALLGNIEAALSDLKRALVLSENVAEDKQVAVDEKEKDFKNLRDNPRFKELVG